MIEEIKRELMAGVHEVDEAEAALYGDPASEGTFHAYLLLEVWDTDGTGYGKRIWEGPRRYDKLLAEFDLAAIARTWHMVWEPTFHLVQWDPMTERDACVVAGCEHRIGWSTSTLLEWLTLPDEEVDSRIDQATIIPDT